MLLPPAMLKIALPATLIALSAAALAVPGGPIGSLQPAAYLCELPGDATGAAGYRVPSEDFTIINANTYNTASGRGTYLLTGDDLVLTSGPKRGQKFHRISANFLRKLGPDGKDSDLRCVRRVINNFPAKDCSAAAGSEQAARCGVNDPVRG
ncbi:MAG TPA: hypothetical protein PKN09_07990 [Novosphingobium sp.]|nr:hypothetical protein [Novosphingobium sp.]